MIIYQVKNDQILGYVSGQFQKFLRSNKYEMAITRFGYI
jgi:hypothetical protein